MFWTYRYTNLLKVFGLILAFAALAPVSALAQTVDQTTAPSVEIYPGQNSASDQTTGVLPGGMKWNRPLKAGDMVLPPAPQAQPTSHQPALVAPTLPVGGLKPPQISTTKKTAQPLAPSNGSSTTSVMLLQGMKNAIQQTGENPDIPKSSLQPAEESGQATQAAQQGPLDLASPKADETGSAGTLVAPTIKKADKDGVNYQPGQEPKPFVVPQVEPVAPDADKSPAAKNDIVFPPEMSDETPKATELKEEPVALTEVTSSTKPKGDTSIFGAPVDEGEGKKIAETSPKTEKTKASCEPKVQNWARNCADVGYPADFAGEVTGETRTECPSGEARDVWLSNTCAPSASKPVQATETIAAKTAPVTAAKAEQKPFIIPPHAGSSKGAAPAAPAPAVMPSVQVMGSVDGSCGVSNGLAALDKPISDLCIAGTATQVLGEGPWRWTCEGHEGGVTVSCAAPVAPREVEPAKKKDEALPSALLAEDAACGSANGVGTDMAPVGELCAKGAPSQVNGTGPWTWACSGTNGGKAAACNAPLRIVGACGSVVNEGSDSMPRRDLCAAGYASAVTGEGPWYWTCSGIQGGQAATCTAKPKVNAVCGSASLKGHRAAPAAGLCSVGKASSVDGNGPWNWNCEGEQGGATVSCKAQVSADGVCGSSNGATFDKAPNEGLCVEGQASRVTGLGPWNWTCLGVEGGATASCTALLGSKVTPQEVAASSGKEVRCGEASEILVLSKPDNKLCASGKASDVDGDGPWTWTCSDDAGHSASCSTLGSMDGVCGKSAEMVSPTMPAVNLCKSGTPSAVSSDKDISLWKWSCTGAMGGSSTSCTAPMTTATKAAEMVETKPAASCGTSAGQSFVEKPSVDLCGTGKASDVKGRGPWSWTCNGSGKKAPKVTCEAQKVVDAVCGAMNGSIQKSAPYAASDLCGAGTATEISGDGPWMWSCVGTGGGSSVSCSAAAQSKTRVDGTCGVAANAIMTSAPTANLCDSGVPSSVYGEGPWTWTCSGLNGGIASTCTSSKVVPKAPPPPGPLVNGLCGPSNGVATLSAPQDDLCSTGAASNVSGNGPWNWSCIGENGGMTVSCTAPLTPPPPVVGSCGSASGVTTMTIPKSGLCSAGIPSAVSGKGPWTWSCSGTNGGGAVSCVAPVATKSNEGVPSLTTPSVMEEAPAPKAAPSGLVTPQLPTGKLKPMQAGDIPSLKPSKPVKLPKEASALPVPALGKTGPSEYVPSLSDNAPLPEPQMSDEMEPQTDKPAASSGTHLFFDPEISTLAFSRGSAELDKQATESLGKIADLLRKNSQVRVTVVAYSATDGAITPRDARHLSLKRALTVRDFLAGKGIQNSRVDVRPMGANVPSGDMDRVDIRPN